MAKSEPPGPASPVVVLLLELLVGRLHRQLRPGLVRRDGRRRRALAARPSAAAAAAALDPAILGRLQRRLGRRLRRARDGALRALGGWRRARGRRLELVDVGPLVVGVVALRLGRLDARALRGPT